MKDKTPKHLVQAHQLICGRAKLQKKNHSKAEFNHLAEVRKIFEDRNIVGLGIAEKMTDKKPTGEMSLCFYVKKKLSKTRLKTGRLIPPVIHIGGGKALFTDVHQIGIVKAQQNVKRNPIQSGFSVSHLEADGPGTLGAIVRDDEDNLFILSNSHVLALGGNALTHTVIYPGKLDTSSSTMQPVAKLFKHVRLKVTTDFKNRADAALAAINSNFSNQINFRIHGVTGTPQIGNPVIGREIVAFGRTSGAMHGKIKDVHCNVPIDIPGIGGIGFANQVRCERYSDDGDSGAIIVDKDSEEIIGLHIGASDTDSVFTPINTVIEELNKNIRFVIS